MTDYFKNKKKMKLNQLKKILDNFGHCTGKDPEIVIPLYGNFDQTDIEVIEHMINTDEDYDWVAMDIINIYIGNGNFDTGLHFYPRYR